MQNNKVFVVHGRNLLARDATYMFLRSLKLDPITWDAAVQLTLLSSPTTFEVVKAGLHVAQSIVVLMTGDDSARLRPEYGQESLMPQPRPNVLFEAGWALATAGRERTILVKFGGLREFTDISGLNMIELDNSPGQRRAFIERLRTAGHTIRLSGTRYLDPSVAGNFEFSVEPDDASPDTLQRGQFTKLLVDSCLSHSISALQLEEEVISYLRDGASPNLKFNYLGAWGAQNWLDLTEDPTYGHDELTSTVRAHAHEIAEACGGATARIDLVSLGPGDGTLDILLLSELQKCVTVANYYPMDLSVELLQAAVHNVVTKGPWFKKDFRIKAIHGDFNALVRYKPIFSFDPAPNLVSLVGYTLGNHNEAELLGKIREAMDVGDFLLVDARLHHEGYRVGQKPTKEMVSEITRNYHHGLNNKFAFGPVEATTNADAASVEFKYEVTSKHTTVPNAVNIVTYVENLNTRFRRSRKKLSKRRIDLAVTTVYDQDALETWLSARGFAIVWKIVERRTALFLLRRIAE